MQFKLHLHHFVLKKVNQSHIIREKATKPAQIIASLIQRREPKGKMNKLPFTAWFVSLTFLMLSCKIANIHWKPTYDTAPSSQSLKVFNLKDKTKWSERSLSITSRSQRLMSSLAINQSSVCPLCWVGTLMRWARWRVGKSDFSDFILCSELESKWSLMSPSMTSFRHLPAGQKIQTWIVWFSADSVCWVDVHIGAGL